MFLILKKSIKLIDKFTAIVQASFVRPKILNSISWDDLKNFFGWPLLARLNDGF